MQRCEVISLNFTLKELIADHRYAYFLLVKMHQKMDLVDHEGVFVIRFPFVFK